MMTWLSRIFVACALAAFIAGVWVAGPMIGFGDARPLEHIWPRALVIAAVLLILSGCYGFRYVRKRLAQNALEAAVAKSDTDDGDARVLAVRMKEAVATLKRKSRKRNFLYELPWYVIIGPPGTGKTTALVNSGLRFPLAGSSEAQPVSGVAGTRYCDWWFAEDAVLLDTAGRYTTQDSDMQADKKSWLAFLAILKRNRPKQPINGVIVAISLLDLMTLNGQDLGAHVVAIRNRLEDIRERLQIELPVYVLFTKADLVAGFAEYFDGYDEERRRKVWGVTFRSRDRDGNLPGQIRLEFGALAERLAEEATDRLHEEPDPARRIAIFGFPAQFDLLKDRVADFLGRVFELGTGRAGINLRGFYFSSGTQEGTPIDQVLGAIGRSFASTAPREHLSGTGKSFFLHDLLSKVIFAEAGWVSRDAATARWAALLRYGGFGAVALLAAALLAALGLSFTTNRSLIVSTDNAAEQLRLAADQMLGSTTVTDVDLENVIEPLGMLRELPVGYSGNDVPVPLRETFGLSQRERLLSASETAYRQALERMFRSRLILQLERTIEAKMGDPIELYEPLKVYLMLGGKAPKIDDELIVTWLKRDWEQNRYPGSTNREGRRELEKHLRAMLELDDDHEPLYELDRPLVEAAQRSLGRMTLADRASALIKSAIYAAALQNFSVSAKAGPEASLVFETTDGTDLTMLNVPGIYTYAGFNDFYLTQLAGVAQQLVDDQWVIGASGEQGDLDQKLQRLGPDLLDRYGKDFAAAWSSVFDHLKFKSMSADKPQYIGLSAAASPTSPIRQLFEAIAYETALTREAESGESSWVPDGGSPSSAADAAAGITLKAADRAQGLARIGVDLPSRKSQSRAGAAFARPAGQNPGASIESQFKPFQILMSGTPGQRPIDALVQNFHDIYQTVLLTAAVPSQAERANANMQLQISSLRANASRLPKSLSRMVHAVADDFEGDAAATSIANLNQMLTATVSKPCQETIANRFPFAGAAAPDVPMADFVTMFAPNGVIDRFFMQNLAPFADTSGQNWEWKQGTRLGRELSKSTLKEFRSAAEIRDAFFPLGGSAPAVNVTFTPLSLHSDADIALLDVNGQIVQSSQAGNNPGLITWPGATSSGSANLSLTPELPGRESVISFEGPWALKRLLDTGTTTRNGDNLEVRFVIGGRDVAYSIQVNSAVNPFTLPALAGFTCPTAL